MKKILTILGVVFVIGLMVYLNLQRGEAAIEVQTEKVFRDDITQMVTGNGKIFPVTEVKISARISGKIEAIYVGEGDSVKAGRVLVRLEQAQYKASLEKARSSLMEAEANLTLAENEYQRAQELFKQDLTSKADLDIAEAKYLQALGRLRQMEASVREAEDALRRTVLVSPIDGVVIKKNKEVGEIALGSQFQEDVILIVADLSEMEARIEVNENDIINVNPGDTALVEIDAFPDTVFQGIVTEISNSAITKGQGTVEEVTNFEVRVKLLNRLPDFRPGMSATADIATETHRNVLNVPIQSVTVRERKVLERKLSPEEKHMQASLDTEGARKTSRKAKDDLMEVVFVVKDGIVEMRPIKLGISDDSYYEVLSGLTEGEEVVTGPYRVLSRTLNDGHRVKVNNRKRERGRDSR